MSATQGFAHIALQCFKLRTVPGLDMDGVKIGNIQDPAHRSVQRDHDEVVEVIPKGVPASSLRHADHFQAQFAQPKLLADRICVREQAAGGDWTEYCDGAPLEVIDIVE
jgi:hypothetical protein